MKITILTLFPEMFSSFLDNSIIKRAIAKEKISFNIVNITDFTLDKNHRVDDYPTGGGAGLIMKCQPVYDALQSVKTENSKVLLTSPRGKTFNQNKAIELSKEEYNEFHVKNSINVPINEISDIDLDKELNMIDVNIKAVNILPR